ACCGHDRRLRRLGWTRRGRGRVQAGRHGAAEALSGGSRLPHVDLLVHALRRRHQLVLRRQRRTGIRDPAGRARRRRGHRRGGGRSWGPWPGETAASRDGTTTRTWRTIGTGSTIWSSEAPRKATAVKTPPRRGLHPRRLDAPTIAPASGRSAPRVRRHALARV